MTRRLLHLDAFSGAAGNMFIGAMLDLGLPRARLLEGLAPLGLEFKLVVRKVQRGGLAARYVDVVVPDSKPAGRRRGSSRSRSAGPAADSEQAHAHLHLHEHAHSHEDDHAHVHGPAPARATGQPRTPSRPADHGRRYAEIHRLLSRSRLAPAVRDRALAIFEALGRAEARVHGIPLADVHFHEVGAVDAIVDVTAAAIAVEALSIDRITCSPVALGHGSVVSAHGVLPLPAPATLELLAGVPTVPAHVAWETVTPTGAAILRTLVDEFGVLPAMTVERIGYGAGNDRPGPMPNVLRAVLGAARAWAATGSP